jgi:hypothetical protein
VEQTPSVRERRNTLEYVDRVDGEFDPGWHHVASGPGGLGELPELVPVVPGVDRPGVEGRSGRTHNCDGSARWPTLQDYAAQNVYCRWRQKPRCFAREKLLMLDETEGSISHAGLPHPQTTLVATRDRLLATLEPTATAHRSAFGRRARSLELPDQRATSEIQLVAPGSRALAFVHGDGRKRSLAFVPKLTTQRSLRRKLRPLGAGFERRLAFGLTRMLCAHHAPVLIGLLFLACTDSRATDHAAQVTSLVKQVKELSEKLEALRGRVVSNELDIILLKPEESVQIGPESTGFQRLDTGTGVFFVSVKNLKAYGDGYRMTLSIGNPQAIAYPDPVIKVSWGRRYDSKRDSDYQAWKAKLPSVQKSVLKSIKSASWNPIDVVIAPATPEETGVILVEVTTPRVEMSRD